jgi:hypothetical protein
VKKKKSSLGLEPLRAVQVTKNNFDCAIGVRRCRTVVADLLILSNPRNVGGHRARFIPPGPCRETCGCTSIKRGYRSNGSTCTQPRVDPKRYELLQPSAHPSRGEGRRIYESGKVDEQLMTRPVGMIRRRPSIYVWNQRSYRHSKVSYN